MLFLKNLLLLLLNIFRYADYVQIMNYDFHIFNKFLPITGLNAPLRANIFEIFVLGKMNSVSIIL